MASVLLQKEHTAINDNYHKNGLLSRNILPLVLGPARLGLFYICASSPQNVTLFFGHFNIFSHIFRRIRMRSAPKPARAAHFSSTFWPAQTNCLVVVKIHSASSTEPLQVANGQFGKDVNSFFGGSQPLGIVGIGYRDGMHSRSPRGIKSPV